jgi:tetratricopeptide (TPR) repeat protein
LHVPAHRLRRAVSAMANELGQSSLRVENLELVDYGKSIAVVAPGTNAPPFDPISGQWVLPLRRPDAGKLHQLESRTAEEWFEIAAGSESHPDTVHEAIFAYQRVIEMAPEWVEAHINLGVAQYHTRRLEDAQRSFLAALSLDPTNAICRYNLGCVLEETGKIDEAIDNLRRAVAAMPAHADAHFNLALAYEKKGDAPRAREHWTLYLKYDPHGTWADKARARIRQLSRGHKPPPPPIPFRKK